MSIFAETSLGGSGAKNYPLGGHRVVVPPSGTPVPVSGVENALGFAAGEGGTLVTSAVQDATEIVEAYADIACLPQTWQASYDWADLRDRFFLPRWPLRSVDSVTAYSLTDQATALNVSEIFRVDTIKTPGVLTLRDTKAISVSLRETDTFRIQYQAGWDDEGAVPRWVQRAIRQLSIYLFEHRGDGCEPGDALEKSGAKAILQSGKEGVRL